MSCFSSCCPTEVGKHQVLSFSWVEKKPLVRWRRNWARNWSRRWRVLCFQRPLLPCIPFINLFTELLIKLSFVFIHCMEQLVCFKQLTFSVIFVHSIKPEIRCMIQVHVMTRQFGLCHLHMGAQSCLGVSKYLKAICFFSCVLSEIKLAGANETDS